MIAVQTVYYGRTDKAAINFAWKYQEKVFQKRCHLLEPCIGLSGREERERQEGVGEVESEGEKD